jgi:hypothetical protein
MHNIILISTVHKETGNCNADELCKIIEKLSPNVVFLEALDETYSKYEKSLFHSFGIYHEKLEISAIQKCTLNIPFKYVPVLDIGLSDAFERKYNTVCENSEFQKLIDKFNSLASENGFKFLNSVESIKLQEEMRILENRLLNSSDVSKAFDEDIDAYENAMIRNIYSYCKSNHFDMAIFLCGVAHRKSIIEKTEKYSAREEVDLNWIKFET